MRSTSSLAAFAAMFAVTFLAVPAMPRGDDPLDARGCHEIVGGGCNSTWTTVPSKPDEH